MSDIHRQAMRDQDLLFSTLTHFLQGSLPLSPSSLDGSPGPAACCLPPLLAPEQGRTASVPLPAAAGLYPSLSACLEMLGKLSPFLPVGYLLKVAVRWVSCLPTAYLPVHMLPEVVPLSERKSGWSACIARLFIRGREPSTNIICATIIKSNDVRGTAPARRQMTSRMTADVVSSLISGLPQ